MKNIPVFLEYLKTFLISDVTQILEDDYSQDEDAADINVQTNDFDGVISFNGGDNPVNGLTPDEVMEQVLKVEHELDEFNKKREL
ncbi:unnamed protein product [Leptosia nina]|uniref:Uncharacterized protein n=1 Tax=Leptosia nina TaxID=320188 RepID=A0AAV1IW68_9NEOP